jgi:hypothetical protein
MEDDGDDSARWNAAQLLWYARRHRTVSLRRR